jgi:hypothetical protein
MRFYRGLIMVKPHGDLIANGAKTLIVKAKRFHSAIGKPLLLIQDKQALGILYLEPFRPISLMQFKRLFTQHQVTERERLKWWPTKETLYAYPIATFHAFARPRNIEYRTGPQVFVKPSSITWSK